MLTLFEICNNPVLSYNPYWILRMLIAVVSILFTIAGEGISRVIVTRRFAIASTPLVSLWGE